MVFASVCRLSRAYFLMAYFAKVVILAYRIEKPIIFFKKSSKGVLRNLRFIVGSNFFSILYSFAFNWLRVIDHSTLGNK